MWPRSVILRCSVSQIRGEMDLRFAHMERRFAELTRTIVFTSIWWVIGATSLAFAAARL